MTIKLIIFDLGGVCFLDGTTLALNKFYKMIDVPKEKIDNIFRESPGKEGRLYRIGKLTEQQFWSIATKKLNLDKIKIVKIKKLWHSEYKPTSGMRALVKKLRKNYNVMVFSGNIKERVDLMNKKHGLDRQFDDYIYSFDVGFNKKDASFYKILVKRIKSKFNCNPKETVYIDNKKEYLNKAKKFGINTILFKNIKQLESDLKSFGIVW